MNDEIKDAVYAQLVQLIKDNVTDDFTINEGDGQRLEVVTKEASYNGKPLEFIAVIVQKHHVGFYFMPVYIDEQLKAKLPDDVDKMLKGKSCFHVKQELTPELQDKYARLIKDGITVYQQRDYI